MLLTMARPDDGSSVAHTFDHLVSHVFFQNYTQTTHSQVVNLESAVIYRSYLHMLPGDVAKWEKEVRSLDS